MRGAVRGRLFFLWVLKRPRRVSFVEVRAVVALHADAAEFLAALESTPQSISLKKFSPPKARSKVSASRYRLFADMKGSMELLADRDPEEARKLLDPVIEHMMEACTDTRDGEQYYGRRDHGAVGAPLAHEDHAARACYAALECRSR